MAVLKVFDILALFSELHRRDFGARQKNQERNPSIYPAVCPDLHTGREEILLKVTSTDRYTNRVARYFLGHCLWIVFGCSVALAVYFKEK